MFLVHSALLALLATMAHADNITETLGDTTYSVAEIDSVRLNTTVNPASTTILPKGHVRHNGSRALPVDIVYEYNQPFLMRDNVTLRADIFRPVQNETVPALVIWGPYGKSGAGPLNLASAALRAGVAESKLSGYESFEGSVLENAAGCDQTLTNSVLVDLILPNGLPEATPSSTLILVVPATPRAISAGGDPPRVRTVTTLSKHSL